MRRLFILIYFSAIAIIVNAQEDLFEGGLLVGGSVIGGDLVQSDLGSFNEASLAYGLMARRYIHANMAIRASLIHTNLKSSDDRFGGAEGFGVSSKTSLTELSVDFMYDILGHQRNFVGGDGAISPYAFAGIGMALAKPKTTFSSNNEQVIADQNADVSNTRIVVPFGVGVRWNMPNKWTIALEFGARPTFSDYLDGVSLAGNPNKNDWYGFGSVQFWYTLSSGGLGE